MQLYLHSDESSLIDWGGQDENDMMGDPILEIHCLTHANDPATPQRLAEKEGQLVLYKLNVCGSPRKVVLFLLLLAGYAGCLLSLACIAMDFLCHGDGECRLYMSPLTYLGTLLLAVVCLVRSNARNRILLEIKNQIVFWVPRGAQARDTFFQLDTDRSSKNYHDPPCPISLLSCKRNASSYVRIACFTLPQERSETHLPITCDAIDMLRHENDFEAVFRSYHARRFETHHGILVIKHPATDPAQHERFLVFLLRSGFSVLCNAPGCCTMVAMKRMHGNTEIWAMDEICIQGSHIALKLTSSAASSPL